MMRLNGGLLMNSSWKETLAEIKIRDMKKKFLEGLDRLIKDAEGIAETEINPDTGSQLTYGELLEVEKELERLVRMKYNPL